MNVLRVRRSPSQFRRAAAEPMTIVEHLVELRSRLFKATLAIAIGMVVGYLLSQPVYELLERPYCAALFEPGEVCRGLQQLDVMAAFLLRLKLSLWVGLILAAPFWLYQLWAFIGPGLHRNERKWAYIFVAIAVPLFVAGAAMAYFVVEKGLHFLIEAGIEGLDVQLEVTGYISFVATAMLVFAVAFEFPLLLLMLNFAGLVSGRQLLRSWRIAVFALTVFAAFTTPDPGPFGMILLAGCLSSMFFIAVGVAFLNDRRRLKNDPYAQLADDEAAPLDDVDAAVAGSDVGGGR